MNDFQSEDLDSSLLEQAFDLVCVMTLNFDLITLQLISRRTVT